MIKGSFIILVIFQVNMVFADGAIVFDPVSFVRVEPNGEILCKIDEIKKIEVIDFNEKWFSTDVCGKTGVIHKSQVKKSNDEDISIKNTIKKQKDFTEKKEYRYDLKKPIEHLHGKRKHTHVFPKNGWGHTHNTKHKAEPVITEEEKDEKNLDLSSWESLNLYLLKYGHLNKEIVDKAYKALFLLRKMSNFPRNNKEFEADLVRYTKKYMKFFNVTISEDGVENIKHINTLPNTPLNLNIKSGTLKLRSYATVKDSPFFPIKEDHEIKVRITIIKTMVTGNSFIGSSDSEEEHKIIYLSTKTSVDHPEVTSFRITLGSDLPIFREFFGIKQSFHYSFKYKIIGID